MIGEIRRLAAAQPFAPFTIHMADGGAVKVSSYDHLFIFPQGTRVIVANDDDSWEILSPLRMSRITTERSPNGVTAS